MEVTEVHKCVSLEVARELPWIVYSRFLSLNTLYLLLGQYVSEAVRQTCLSVEAMLSKLHAHSVGKPIAPQTKGRLL